MRRFILAVLALASSAANAQDVSGPASATDGDTLSIAGIVIRLHGIDAVEFKQHCARAGASWSCGKDAADKLASMVEGQSVRCEQRDTDDYDRVVATCRVGQTDLSAAMVDAGLAVALPHFSTFYVSNEARARARRIGIWDSEFQQPADYRAANPSRRSIPARPSVGQRQYLAPQTPPGVFFRNCKEARAAGAAPIYRGQPGYRPEMDGDGDGVACEPYRGG